MSPRPSGERRALLDFARRVMVAVVNAAPAPRAPQLPVFDERGAGVFVTLHQARRLRGCIGQVQPLGNLAETLAHCAAAAALEDPRFPPVSPEEVSSLEIEISLLSAPEPIEKERIEVGLHGLIVRQGYFSGLLLPQVATRFQWTGERFLEETCVKAGLPRDAWKDPDTRVLAFAAEVFSEAELRAEELTPGAVF